MEQKRFAANRDPEVVFPGTPASDRLFSAFSVGASRCGDPLRTPAVAISNSRPRARSRSVDAFASVVTTRPKPIRASQPTAISNSQIPRLEPNLTPAKSASISFLIAKNDDPTRVVGLSDQREPKDLSSTSAAFAVAEARQRHLNSVPHYAYLSRYAFERQNANHARRERVADVFGVKPRRSNRLCRRLEFDVTHCEQTTDADSNRRKSNN